MLTVIRSGAGAMLALVAGAAGVAGSEHSLVLQQGLAGYAGVRDTWVSRQDWDHPPQHLVNYGLNQELTLSRDGGDNPLLSFDVGAVPGNSAVISATLYLYNTTASSYSGSRDFVRRIELHRVLRPWDEGNQIASPVDAPGKHGATGDLAFDFFTGEGTDVPWDERGMAAGSDYSRASESAADVVNAGWYSWDVTALVRSWIRGELPNHGLVLRDASGYADDHLDWRSFVSSQASADPALRPKLLLLYNPDTPWANAGPDQVDLGWTGGPVTLDGAASHDRPGGDTATLAYSWRVLSAAYGSHLGGAPFGSSATVELTPDAAGEWEIELTVTNALGEHAADTVHLRLLRLAASHPRIYLTPARLAALRARAIPGNERWSGLLAEADDPEGEMHAKALVSQVTGQGSYCDQAISQALALAAEPGDYSTRSGDLALVYDWCHDRLTPSQRATLVDYFNAWGDATPKGNDAPGWGNYWPRWGYSYALVGLATWGDNPRAQEWLDEFRHRRFRDLDLALLEHLADGGAWPEGTVYDWIANYPRVKAIEAWRTATGEDLFASTAWFRNRLGYILLHRWPGIAEQWGVPFHPYPSTGDAERNRGSMANYERIMALILIARFPGDTLARQLQAYLATPPANASQSFLVHDEFLWFDPGQPEEPPGPLTHYSRATGTVLMRSAWPTGAADTDASATYITFQAGDHFSYHQHYDQNSFTLYKRSDLAVDSGVYSGDGLSNHDINYYVRTIAHNTLVVYNPGEDFQSARPDASSNDGGQHTTYPASRAPESETYFQQHAAQYETGDILRFEDETRFTYALGDATRAYNSSVYNQAVDTAMAGNVAKVSRFQRSLVYLRPVSSAGAAAPDFLVLCDRVGVTEPRFSGANTKLLFHTLGEGVVDGIATTVSPGETLYANPTQATATNGDGKLFLRFLLPAARRVRKVGGRGEKAFWVWDANYDWQWDPAEPQPRPLNDFEEVPYGEWRLELEPGDDALDHTFLTVLHPAPASATAMPAATLVSGTGVVGVHLASPELNRLVLFSAAADGSAPPGTISYSFTPTAGTLHLLFDLPPGARYRVETSGGASQTVVVTPDQGGHYLASAQGVLPFELAPTAHRLRRRLARP